MREAQNLNFNVSAGKNSKNGRINKPLTYDDVVKWIKNKGIDEEITNELIKLASNYPSDYMQFIKNYQTYLTRIQKIINKKRKGTLG